MQHLVESKAIPKGTSPFDVVRRRYLKALADHTGRCAILYASKWTQGGVEPGIISITPEDIQGFMEVVHGLPDNGVDLVLHLPGGSIENHLGKAFVKQHQVMMLQQQAAGQPPPPPAPPAK